MSSHLSLQLKYMIVYVFICNIKSHPQYAGGIWKRNNYRSSSKTPAGNSYDYRDVIVFEKHRFLHTKTQNRRFQIPQFEERLGKASFW